MDWIASSIMAHRGSSFGGQPDTHKLTEAKRPAPIKVTMPPSIMAGGSRPAESPASPVTGATSP